MSDPYGAFALDNPGPGVSGGQGAGWSDIGKGAGNGASTGSALGPYGALAGAALGAGANAYAASQSPQVRQPNTKRIPPPDYIQALQHLVGRVLASNINAQGPTFGSFVDSGGTAGFGLKNTDLSPIQAQQLGLVGASGEEIPRVSADQHKLTPEQELWLGYQQHRAGYKKGEGWKKGAMGFYDTYQHAQNVGKQLADPHLSDKKRAHLEQQQASLMDMYKQFIDRNENNTIGGRGGGPEQNAPAYPVPY